MDWSIDLWDAVQKTIKEKNIDLIVMGTHGRTGADKFFMGSVAEEIFRRSPVPVLTIGPHVRSSVHTGGRFRRVLFPTDFTGPLSQPHPMPFRWRRKIRPNSYCSMSCGLLNCGVATAAKKVAAIKVNSVKTNRGASNCP